MYPAEFKKTFSSMRAGTMILLSYIYFSELHVPILYHAKQTEDNHICGWKNEWVKNSVIWPSTDFNADQNIKEILNQKALSCIIVLNRNWLHLLFIISLLFVLMGRV